MAVWAHRYLRRRAAARRCSLSILQLTRDRWSGHPPVWVKWPRRQSPAAAPGPITRCGWWRIRP